ncbi:hypothetical protein L195_g017236 [Trifolium pratense]|uniref:Uncharacterized protein n=1 Tax=Trifolium pratense TaxID=57577 RepID=A0A2K3MTP0_TRIPR|nr:hypothetical protein L195_g017236 [Trifolium pratense]
MNHTLSLTNLTEAKRMMNCTIAIEAGETSGVKVRRGEERKRKQSTQTESEN